MSSRVNTASDNMDKLRDEFQLSHAVTGDGHECLSKSQQQMGLENAALRAKVEALEDRMKIMSPAHFEAMDIRMRDMQAKYSFLIIITFSFFQASTTL